MATTYDRFWAQVDRTGGPAACWPWTGPVTPAGTPFFEVRRRRTTARRYAYRMQYGDPGSLRVVATCDLLVCVNWRHATVATARQIALTNGSAAATNARGHCTRGHDLTAPGALYTHPRDGRRECALCKELRRTGKLYKFVEPLNLGHE